MEESTRSTFFARPDRTDPEEIARERERLEAVQVSLRIFDTIPALMMVLDENRQVVLINKAFRDHFSVQGIPFEHGLRPGEALNCIHSHEMDAGCGTSEACRECGAIRAVLESQKGRQVTEECRLLVQRREGVEALDVQVGAAPMDLDGKRFSVVTLLDISHEKRRRALERIFFHDILGTAGVLTGYASLLRDHSGFDPEEGLERISQAARKLVAEIRSQRDLMAAEAGELELTIDALKPVAFAEQLVSIYDASGLADYHPVRFDPSSSCARSLVTDPTLLGRVLGNMVTNALEGSPEGGKVTMGCRDEEDGVLFWVHNEAFIPRNVQVQIFQRSFSTKGRGRGLGTYSMKLLGENFLGGKVSFVSTEEEGTTFQVWLPLSPPGMEGLGEG